MNELKKVLESSMKIRFHDCDPFSHLNNSRYIDYIMTARGDQLIDHYNLDIYQLAREKGIGWVSAQTQLSHFSPAFVMEEVIIQTQLIYHSEKSLLLEGIMWNRNKTKLKAMMWTKLVHFDIAKQKSLSHSTELMELFNKISNPLSGEPSFEKRVFDLRNLSPGVDTKSVSVS